MKRKFYAVRRGRNPGIYDSWEACSKQVNKFSGACFQAFQTKAEADEFLTSDEKSLKYFMKQSENSCSIGNVKLNQFNTVVEKLVKEFECQKDAYLHDTKLEKKLLLDNEKEICYQLKLYFNKSRKPAKILEKLTVHYYKRTRKVHVQGVLRYMFSTFISYITQLLSDKSESEYLKDIYYEVCNIDLDKYPIEDEYKHYLPHAYNKLPEVLARTLHQAVVNLHLDVAVYDGTFLAQPVIRGIDGHLKNVLSKNHIEWCSDKKKARYTCFSYDDKENRYRLSEKYCPSGMLGPMKDYIGECYDFISEQRNVLSHWDDITAPLDTTRLLTADDAHDLIKRTFKIIDEYYQISS